MMVHNNTKVYKVEKVTEKRKDKQTWIDYAKDLVKDAMVHFRKFMSKEFPTKNLFLFR